MTFEAHLYKTRKQLERDVISKLGSDFNLNKESKIQGSAEDLKRLSLSERTTVYGVRVIII